LPLSSRHFYFLINIFSRFSLQRESAKFFLPRANLPTPMGEKQPRSIQVIIFAEGSTGREFLLLKRVAAQGGFWQPVTGSLEVGETHQEAAAREVFEETGIHCRVEALIDLGLTQVFEIAPQWRGRYAAGVTHNEEVCFALQVEKCEVRLDALEHEDCLWLDAESAGEKFYWESNKKALAKFLSLPDRTADRF
jgi:dihydroneopterin triphosphate diphosphatase